MKTKPIAFIAAGGVLAFVLAQAPARAADDTITFGAAVSLTGKYSTDGAHTKRGYDLAVERINAKGGIKVGGKSHKLAIKYYDDESTSARGAQLVERLIQQDHIKFVLGPYGSGPTVAVAPVIEKHKIPMVEGNGAARELFTRGYKYLFAVLSTSDYYLREAVHLAAEQAEKMGKKPSSVKVAIAVENDPFSLDVRAGVEEDAKKYGMKIVIDDRLPKEINDMTVTLTKARALKPDLLVVSGHAKGAALAVRQVAEQKIKVPILALTHCESAQIEKKYAAAAEGALCAAQWAPSMSYKGKLFGSAAQYAKDFEKEYHYVPPYQAAESTASVLVFANAMEKADSLDKDKVRDALAKTDLMTFYGPIKFDKTGKNVAKPMVLRQIQHGKYVPVAPTKFADGKLVYPRTGS
jgi:branched-chain amino acid transport system substrate-binding protein